MKVTVLGARGSMPVTGKEYLKYGGDTTSYLIETKTQAIFLDAGTGIAHAPETKKQLSILISHPHLDHLMGIPFFRPFYYPDNKIDIYGKFREGLTTAQQIGHLMMPPLWPVGLDVFAAEILCHDTENRFFIGEVQVDTFENGHPGGCSAFRITAEGNTVVFSGDYEHDNGEKDRAFAGFSQDADLLIYDGQYSVEEYGRRRSFGHSTPERGLELLNMSGSKRILFTHHDPFHTDEYISNAEKTLTSVCSAASFAKEGEVISL